MESYPLIEFLHGAYQELRRLDLLLQQTPVYRTFEALRRLVAEYEARHLRPGRRSVRAERPYRPIEPATVSSPNTRPELIGKLKPGLSPDEVVSARIVPSVPAR